MENKQNEILENNMSEEKIETLLNYKAIVKDIVLVPTKTKSFTFYQFKVILQAGNANTAIQLRVDDKFVNMVSTANKLGLKLVKNKELVREQSGTKPAYVCLRVELYDGKMFRFFIDRADEVTIDMLYSAVEKK